MLFVSAKDKAYALIAKLGSAPLDVANRVHKRLAIRRTRYLFIGTSCMVRPCYTLKGSNEAQVAQSSHRNLHRRTVMCTYDIKFAERLTIKSHPHRLDILLQGSYHFKLQFIVCRPCQPWWVLPSDHRIVYLHICLSP